MKDLNKEISARIKELRIGKNLAQNTVAQALSITVTAYNRIENNKTQLTVNNLFAIAEALDIPVAELLNLPFGNTVNNKNSMVMANFNNGSLQLSISGEDLQKYIASDMG